MKAPQVRAIEDPVDALECGDGAAERPLLIAYRPSATGFDGDPVGLSRRQYTDRKSAFIRTALERG